jgi:Ca-activated chloride channel homolog
MMAILLPVVLLLAAISINIAYLELNRSEMIIASDAVSRATGREFMVSNSTTSARAKGRDAGSRNSIGGKPLQLADGDFVFGQSGRSGLSDRYTFTAGGNNPNAVEVTARRNTGSIDGPLGLLLPSILPISQVESTQISRSNQVEVDVVLVIDRSGSMAYAANEPAVFPPIPAAAPPGWLFNGPAPNPSRWRDLVAAVDVFLMELTASPINEMVGLATYNGNANIDQLLSSNYNSIRGALDNYTNFFQSGKTNIGGGINAGQNCFAFSGTRPFAARVMIVLTDGIDTVGSNPVAAAISAANEKIMIFSITFALEADQSTMQSVANAALGKHYHATNGTNLSLVFKDIARQLPVLISK